MRLTRPLLQRNCIEAGDHPSGTDIDEQYLPASPCTLHWCAALALMLCAAQPALADGAVVRVGGTGIALAALQQVGASLTATEPGIRVDVLPSMGTPGGIKALVEGAIDVAVVARALKPEEKAKGVAEAACLTTALVFASSHKAAQGITERNCRTYTPIRHRNGRTVCGSRSSCAHAPDRRIPIWSPQFPRWAPRSMPRSSAPAWPSPRPIRTTSSSPRRSPARSP